MTPFFAHLCLFIQMIDLPVSPFATQVILEAYLQVLENAGQWLSGNAHERHLALTRARKHGLNVEHVTVFTAERTMEKVFTILPLVKGPLPSIIGLEPAPTDAEWLLVRSIEWTTFVESTYDTALEQADVILRYLLGDGVLERPQMNKETTRRASWLSNHKGLISQAREDTIKLLTTDWLMADIEVNGGEQRRHDLIRIGQIYIPEPIIRLHSILVTLRSQVSENVKHALSACQHGRRFALQVVQ
ncbi:hypothetical protein C8Q74DRAFT_1374190 [Fomes fomentarius]|nr:hypothetical protein C8Q74DRAFT_1374190 [Fomes fomentarius]